MRAELGDALERGAPLLTIYANDEAQLAAARPECYPVGKGALRRTRTIRPARLSRSAKRAPSRHR